MSMPIAKHRLAGHINPRCVTCRRTPMQIQANPRAACEWMTLPFGDIQPTPAKADLRRPVEKERAS